MHKIKFLALSLFAVVQLAAQKNDSIPEPEFINTIYQYKKSEKTLESLESTQSEMKTKSKMMGMGGAEQLYLIEGNHSSIRLNADSLYFVVSVGGGMMMDPSMMIKLHKFESKKKTREATIANYGGMGVGGNKQKDDGSVTLNFKKIKEGVYAIFPAKKLERGEYGFINQMSMQGGGMSMKLATYAFAID